MGIEIEWQSVIILVAVITVAHLALFMAVGAIFSVNPIDEDPFFVLGYLSGLSLLIIYKFSNI